VRQRILGVSAQGGADTCEDVAGGLAQLAAIPWRGDVRVVFHVADAPPHGMAYHAPHVSDD
jgi:hypothetical protein